MISTAPQHIRTRYMRGQCFALAHALHNLTKQSIWGLREGGIGAIHHAFIADPKAGLGYDIRGQLPIERIADGAVPGLIAVPITLADLMDQVGSFDPAELREARRVVREHLKLLPAPVAAVSREAPEAMAIREEVIRRGEIAAHLFDWSEERLQAFRAETSQRPISFGSQPEWLLPEEFGLCEEEVLSPGPERRMDRKMRAAFGRRDAAQALASWSEAEPAPLTGEDLIRFAEAYLDNADRDVMAAGEVHMDVINPQDVEGLYTEGAVSFIRDEHHAKIAEGDSGYANLVLERMRMPCVVIRYDGGDLQIADGWHRFAAACAVGAQTMPAAVVPLPGPQYPRVW
ncbi:hypothetical protein ACEUZ9_000873 [Paracoccus litorisediminis]|uniref:hypothetical protein n=1 Tax=Paracoccus litorisediminis TaxID=2006130 RepID=UPI00372F376D